MNPINFLSEIPAEFLPSSKVWIFQSSRNLSEREVIEIEEQLAHFYLQWKSHGNPVIGWGKIFFNRFIVILADEERSTNLGGCSGDELFRVINSLQRQYEIQFLERLNLAFLVNEKVEALPMQQLQYAIDKGFINEDTLYFDNTITHLAALKTSWMVPIKNTWLKNRLNFNNTIPAQ